MKKLLILSLALVALASPALAQNALVQYNSNDNTQRITVKPNAPLPVTGTVTINGSSGETTTNALKSFRQSCTTSAVALASNAFSNGFVIKAAIANSSIAYIGPLGVLTSTGYPLAGGEAISYGAANSNQAYLICSAANGEVAVTGN